MKRLMLAIVLAVAFMLVGVSSSSADAPTGVGGGGGGGGSWGHVKAAAVPVAVPQARLPGWIYQGDAIMCVGEIGFGFVSIGGAIWGGPPTWWAYGSLASGTYSIVTAAYNRDCAADSFYNHIGERELCYQKHFLGWDPTGSGKPILDTRDDVCKILPSGLDNVYCNFLHGPYDGIGVGCGAGGGGGGSW